ncbi:MAG: MerR family transcriptional regulator [Candidatus Thiodiazotropha sp. (ex. Lucinoma kazani)]
MTINELAVKSEAPAQVVRYYARIGLIQPAGQQENGYRLFSHEDASRLRFIRLAKQLGFTLNEIKQIIRYADMDESPCDDVRNIIQHRIEENRLKIKTMMQLQSRMEQALEQWRHMPNGVPDGPSICYLIESIESNETEELYHQKVSGGVHGTSS